MLMPNLGATELIIILVIVIILFGVGRVGRIGGELGTAIREFRRGLSARIEEDEEEKQEEQGD
jgi:sec-independent protein translocase protein TatA